MILILVLVFGLVCSHRLRRVIRQAFVTGRKWFKQDGSLLLELSRRVVDMLGGVYPELDRNLDNVHTLLRFEQELFQHHLSRSNRQWSDILTRYPELSTLPADQQPGIVAAMPQLEHWASLTTADPPTVPASLAFKLYNTHGLQEESLELLATLKRWAVDWTGYHGLLADFRMDTLHQSACSSHLVGHFKSALTAAPTEWQCQDIYTRTEDGAYRFKRLDATVLALLDDDGRLVDEATQGQRVSFVLDKSCFYCEAGGQTGDTGQLVGPTGRARLEKASRQQDHIYHLGLVTDGSFRLGGRVQLAIDPVDRLNCMSNHTATHLLQAALKKVLRVTCQKSSYVTPNYLRYYLASG